MIRRHFQFKCGCFRACTVCFLAVASTWAQATAERVKGKAQTATSFAWMDQMVTMSVPGKSLAVPSLQVLRQDFEQLELGQSVIETPMRIGRRRFTHGLGTHSVSQIRITSADPITRFSAGVGVDRNERTKGGNGSVVFSVASGGKELHKTEILRGGQEAERIEVALENVKELDLLVGDGGDGPGFDHADWADAQITTIDGGSWWLDELQQTGQASIRSPYPFSFKYDGRISSDYLKAGREMKTLQTLTKGGCSRTCTTWDDAASGLRVTCTTTRFVDFPAVEWLLSFENIGKSDTKLIEDVQACDLTFASPMPGNTPYLLHRTHGGSANPAQFEVSTLPIDAKHPQMLAAGSGRSSSVDFPFFKIDTGRGSAIIAVGWSGCWNADLASPDGRQLRVTAGLAKTHFVLHPGEEVRSPRMLALFWSGDSWEANARFRELIYKHYGAKRDGKQVEPMLFCNTCFTRGGGWLNECNAENQISLINAYAPFGLEALLTDAGWFEGGWPKGAGNWNPRKDAYPQGMGPVAAAAKAKGMIYGLWFEPERVVAGTDLHRNHPDWLLHRKTGDDDTYLLNFGLPEVQEYFLNIVKGFMDLPGFRFYRQDFNMDPLPYWRFSDAPDRQGMSEMKYIEGLYAYWDRIAKAWPDSVREECASGGNRIDLETVMHLHLHQKTDYWFDDDVDQAALWGSSQYLPNGTMVAHLNKLDTYSFHSTLASSLCLGWIADAPDFDKAAAKKLADRYLAVRHLLNGAWYPLLPYPRASTDWTGSQFHRDDLDEGMLLVFRHAGSPYRTAELCLQGLTPEVQYEVLSDSSGVLGTFSGAELAKRMVITLPERRSSDLITYRKK